MAFTPVDYIASYFGWNQFTPALPNFYWDVYSAEERVKKICFEIDKLCQYANMLSDNINIDHTLIKELQDALHNIENLDEIDEKVLALQESADMIQTTLDALPSYEEFTTLSQRVTLNTNNKVPYPTAPNSKYGNDGQVLRSNGDGSTKWQNPIVPTDQQAETYINAWLDEHPEATTTVLDGSVTTPKIADGAVTDIKLAQNGGILSKVGDLSTDLKLAEKALGTKFAINRVIDIDETSSTATNPDRVYLFNNIFTSIGYKTIKLKVTSTRDGILYKIKSENGLYKIYETITAPSVDGYVTFENIYTDADTYIAFSGCAALYRSDVTILSFKTGFRSEISDNTLGTLTDTSLGIIGTIIAFDIPYINPDDFTGNDNEKLQQAFDALPNGGVIEITREYTITTRISISHIYSRNSLIYVNGYTNNSVIRHNAYNAYFVGTAGNTGGVIFRGIKFIGNMNVESGTKIMSPGSGTIGSEGHTALVGVTFEECVMSNFRYLVEGNHYLQSLSLIRCTIRDMSMCINCGDGILYGLNVWHCIIEGCGTFLRVVAPEACNIVGNVIEGSNLIPIVFITYSIGGINIEGNYFEGNNTAGEEHGLCIDMSRMQAERPRNVRIVGNFFYQNGHSILLPNVGVEQDPKFGGITIMNNSNIVMGGSTETEGAMITGDNSVVYNEVFCFSNSGPITDLPSTSLKVLSPFDVAKVLDL